MGKIEGKFDDMDKSANFALMGVFALFPGVICLLMLDMANGSLASHILTFGLLGISLVLFSISLFYYVTPVKLQFSITNGKLTVEACRFNKLIKTYTALKWDICILNIAGRYSTRLALAIKITTDRESFCITENIDGTKIYGYPIISWGYNEKYSCNDPGTIVRVVKVLESLSDFEKSNSAITNGNC